MNALPVRRGPRGEPLTTRIERRSIPEPNTGCWLWTGVITPGGYGRIQLAHGSVSAHRTSYETFVGPIPDGLEIDHKCRVRACVNPRHLEAVTHLENMRRSSKGPLLQKRCHRGHPLAGENLLPNKQNRRKCRTCNYFFQSARNYLLCPKCGRDAKWPSIGHTQVTCVDCGHVWDQQIPQKRTPASLPSPTPEAEQ